MTKPIIACIHLMPLPGSPNYDGSIQRIYDIALTETQMYANAGVDGLIVENFRDVPFYPSQLPPETIAAMASVTREIVNLYKGPVGVNALRNDAAAAMAIATATDASFIRVNVHTGAVITDQGMIEGKAHETLRLKAALKSNALIFADVAVKHATPLGNRGIDLETKDLTERGLADAIIVSGNRTGGAADIKELEIVRKNTHLPLLLGSGVTISNLEDYYPLADGFIVGSTFKKDGKATNTVEKERVLKFMEKHQSLKHQ
ncbi:MAG: BtpA/SgcQ family protein [Bacteroidales bacterium]